MRNVTVLGLALCLCAAAGGVDSVDKGNDDVWVGVEYFAGWWEASPNKWGVGRGGDWRPRFPGRVPLLGAYNTQETMDREIVAAAEHGVDFFVILWYYHRPGEEKEPHSPLLNRALDQFQASPEAHRMRFMAEFCNHAPFEVETEEDWAACVDVFVRAMAHPSYLRVDGRPVLKVHGGGQFYNQNGGDLNVCHARLEALRQAAREAGVGDPLIGCGVGGGQRIPAGHWAAQVFDFTATYMDVPQLEQAEDDYPYETLAAYIREGRTNHAADAVPYVPFIAAGWNPRPWPDPRAYFAFPTPEAWVRELERVRDDLRGTDAFGLPTADGKTQKAFTVYAWNEYGEGGMLAPTEGRQYGMLEGVRQVFGE